MASAKAKYSCAPLTEVIFGVEWALQNVAQAIKYDIGLDQAVFSLRRRLGELGFTDFERRIPQGFGLPYTLNYEPAYRFRPEGKPFPLVSLGAGVFLVHEDGKDYAFETFREVVAERIDLLREAYASVDDPGAAPRPRRFSFHQFNRIDLRDWDEYRQLPAGERTLASSFIRDYLNFDLTTPLQPLEKQGVSLYRQELSRTYELPGDLGRLGITVRDASESPAEQVVEWEQEVICARDDESLRADQTSAWLQDVHRYTHATFGLLCSDAELTNYFDRTPCP